MELPAELLPSSPPHLAISSACGYDQTVQTENEALRAENASLKIENVALKQRIAAINADAFARKETDPLAKPLPTEAKLHVSGPIHPKTASYQPHPFN